MSISCNILSWDEARDRARAIRYAVFCVEQNIPVSLEWDDMDAPSRHALAFDESGTVLGTGRLLPDGHIGRMAVLAAARGKGVGGIILEALVEEARALGMAAVVLNAQTHADAFYVTHGFQRYGEEFIEAQIPHVAMQRVFS